MHFAYTTHKIEEDFKFNPHDKTKRFIRNIIFQFEIYLWRKLQTENRCTAAATPQNSI